MSSYTRIVLAERPETNITSSTFRKETVPFDLKPADGEVLVQMQYLSLDPGLRVWIDEGRSYTPPIQIGQTMGGFGLGVVIKAGPGSTLKEGDRVFGALGWTEYALLKETELQKIQVAKGAELLDYLGPLGPIGYTAYFGLLDVGKIKAGETLVVSGAAGATGSIVCQIGKKQGAKVIAIAGTPEKCQWLEQELGVDKALNYKSPTFYDDLKAIGYVDVFFDNVGGEILNFILTRLNPYARIVLCGAISGYNSKQPYPLTAYPNLIAMKSKMEGFVVFDYSGRFPEAAKEIATWLEEGSLKRKFHIVEGLEKAPEAILLLFNGGNTGKLVVKLN